MVTVRLFHDDEIDPPGLVHRPEKFKDDLFTLEEPNNHSESFWICVSGKKNWAGN